MEDALAQRYAPQGAARLPVLVELPTGEGPPHGHGLPVDVAARECEPLLRAQAGTAAKTTSGPHGPNSLGAGLALLPRLEGRISARRGSGLGTSLAARAARAISGQSRAERVLVAVPSWAAIGMD